MHTMSAVVLQEQSSCNDLETPAGRVKKYLLGWSDVECAPSKAWRRRKK
jgi:hypothetical protein